MATVQFSSRPEEIHVAGAEGTGGRELDRPERLFSLQSQASSTASSSGGRVKPVTLVVYTMREGEHYELRFPSGRLTTAAQVIETVLQEMKMPAENSGAFSLWLTSKHLQLQLKSYHLPCKIFKRWRDLLSQYTNTSYEAVCKDEPILSFQRNAFYPLKEERKLLDPKRNAGKAIDLLYHEAVFNVTRARYPMPEADLHTLAGLQAAIFTAETGEGRDIASLRTRLYQFYPQHMIATDPKKAIKKLFTKISLGPIPETKGLAAQFELALQKAMERVSDPQQLKVFYLQLCWSKPFYGSVMFRGQIERPFNPVHLLSYSDKQVTVAINTHCLHVIEARNKPDIVLFLTYEQLSWEFEPASEEGEDFYSSLWLEFDSVVDTPTGEERKVSKRVQIFSRQAPMMDAMITRCVADIESQEEQLRKKRVEQGGEEYLPDVCIKTHAAGESPRSQRQERNYKEHKLRCTTYSEGEIIDDGGFTLTRALKKRVGKKTVTTPTGTSGSPRHAPSGSEEQSIPLTSRETGSQRDSGTSKESMTDL